MRRPARLNDEVVTAFRDGQVTARTRRREEGFTFALKEIGYHGVRRGDLVVHAMDGFAGAIGVSEADGKCSPVCTVLAPSGPAEPRFYAYLLRDLATNGFVASLSRGIRERSTDFRFATLKEFVLPVPEVSEQRRIADFLDRKTGAIDELIAKKERLIELLEEKRQALITQAVTKGLDPNVPMKDSGIEWLGQIPAHWTCAPVYSKFSVQLGKMLDAGKRTGMHLRPYLRNANIQWDGIDLSDVREMDFAPTERERFLLRKGDLLVCEGGANINVVGKAAIWNGEIAECYYQKALHRIRSRGEDHPEFLLQLLRVAHVLGVFIAQANPNTVFHLTAEKLKAQRFPFPPPSEQLRIVSKLRADLEPFRAALAAVPSSCEKLREYRSALITAAVTGRLELA